MVVPIYNEEGNIRELHKSITDAVQDKVDSYEIVLVDDGSKDRTALILDEVARSDKSVKVIHFEKHCGQTAAVWAGIRQSRGELVALMDADLQSDPRDIFRLMPFIGRVDFVNGKRENRKDTFLKRISSWIGSGVRNWLTGERIQDSVSPLKLMRREVADSFFLYNGMHRFLPTLAKMNGFTVIEVTVTHQERKHGHSKYGVLSPAITGFVDAAVIGWLKKGSSGTASDLSLIWINEKLSEIGRGCGGWPSF